MEGFNKKFLADVLKYYGFAFNIPLGKCLLEIVFNGQASITAMLISLGSLMFGIICFTIGGNINKDDK